MVAWKRVNGSVSQFSCFSENEGVDDPDLYEGDMILTADQKMAAELGLDVDNPLGRGSAKNRQWPGGVMAYLIDSSLCKLTYTM